MIKNIVELLFKSIRLPPFKATWWLVGRFFGWLRFRWGWCRFYNWFLWTPWRDDCGIVGTAAGRGWAAPATRGVHVDDEVLPVHAAVPRELVVVKLDPRDAAQALLQTTESRFRLASTWAIKLKVGRDIKLTSRILIFSSISLLTIFLGEWAQCKTNYETRYCNQLYKTWMHFLLAISRVSIDFCSDDGQLMRGRGRGKRTKLTSFNKDHVFLPFLVLSVEQEAEL